MTGRGRVGFLKPQDDGESYEEDRPDIQPLSQTSFVYDAHPGQALDAHRARLPVAKARDQLLYLLEMHQVLLFDKLPIQDFHLFRWWWLLERPEVESPLRSLNT